ncbi:efflux RND transporter permease subunit [Coralliovum pocilloporae]|uniref:efflux RND transporter permease subunit n=1 Tax=Coralliovum pocilloporae TaxID=3066369 RepID=UPI00330792AE
MISRSHVVAPGLAALAYRLPASLIMIAVLAASILVLPSIRFDNDIQRGFISDSPRSKSYTRFVAAMNGKPQVAALLIEADRPFTTQDYEAMRDLALDLEFADRVQTVFSPFSARFPKTHPLYAEQPVFPLELDLATLDTRLDAYKEAVPTLRFPVTEDHRKALIIAPLDPPGQAHGEQTSVETVRDILAGHPLPGLRLTLTGEAAIAIDMVDNLKSEVVVVNGAGTVLSFTLAVFLLGSIRAALVVFIPAICGALVAMTVFVLFGYPITILNVVVPILILLLGAADGFHLTMHFQHMDPARTRDDRLRQTLLDVGPANALTSLTTAIGFTAISVSEFDQLDELALLGAVGVLVSYLVVLVGFTLIAPLAPPLSTPRGARLWSQAARFLHRHSRQSARMIMVVSLLLSALGAASYLETRAWFPLYKNLPETSDVRRANRVIEEHFGGFFRIWSDVDISGDDGWQKLRDVTEVIRREAPDYSVLSLASVADWLGTPDRLPDDDALADMPQGLKAQLLSPDRTRARVITFVPEPMHSPETFARHDRIEKAALQAGAESNVGFPIILRHDALDVVSQLGNGLIAACLIASLVVAVAFRRLVLVICLLLPNVLPLLIAAVLVHLMNAGQLNPPAVLALTVAFGIAIDDAIHFTNRYLLERRNGHPLDEALRISIDQTGRIMTATTLTICIGLIATQFSPFGTVRLFGAMMATTFVAALLADLVLLPALLRRKWAQ